MRSTPRPPMWRRYLRFWGPDIEADVEDELDFHLDMRTQELIESGWPRNEARQEALRLFGDVQDVTSECRSIDRRREKTIRRAALFEDLRQDLSLAVRMLLQKPGFSLMVVLSLALGIGVNTALYSLFDAWWKLPHRLEEPETLAYLWHRSPHHQRSVMSTSDYLDCREQSNSFAQMAAFTRGNRILAGHGEPERVRVVAASASLWPMLGFSAQIGRVHNEREDLPADSGVVMLTEKFWQRKFDGDPDILGKSVLLDDKSHTIIGVMPPEIDLEESNLMWHGVDLFAPFSTRTADTGRRDGGYCSVLARLEPGVSFEQAQSELSGVSARLAEAYPETNKGSQIWVQPLMQSFRSFEDLMLMSIFLAAVAAVLLIACVNIANMQLAKASSRVREFAVRMAMGAKRGRLVRQLLTESLLLAVGGGVLGLLVGLWMLDLFVASVDFVPFLEHEMGLSPSVLIYTSVISLCAALVFGLAPVFVASRISPVDTLKTGTQATASGPSHSRLRNALVIGQLAIGLPMIICCGLAVRHVQTLKSADVLGINPENLLTLRLELPTYHYAEEVQRAAFYEQMFERIVALPGIESAGAVSSLPIGSVQRLGGSITIEGRQEKEEHFSGYHVVTPGLFGAMGVRLASGRVFTERDNAAGPPVAILNQKAAMRYWPDGDAVGRQILLDGPDYKASWVSIVGVVADFGCTVWGEPFPPALYIPHGQNPRPGMDLIVRAQGDLKAAIESMRETIHGMDAGIPVYSIRTIDDIVHNWLRDDRWLSYFLGGLALLVLCLACIGLFGIMSYAVARRTNELGIRIAMGANRGEILWLVIKGCLELSGKGILIGLLLSIPIGIFMASNLYGVGGLDPLTYGGVVLLLLAVALAAGYLPARRATRIDPTLALRYE